MTNLKFDPKAVQKSLHACVDEMYPMEKGVFIERPDEIMLQCGDSCLTRKQIKHIVEQRKSEGKSVDEVKQMFGRLPEVIAGFDFQMLNPNQKYSGSILRVKVFKSWEHGIVVVLDAERKGQRDIITAYPYRPIYAYFLLLKKLDTSAAGKTPHPKDLLMG